MPLDVKYNATTVAGAVGPDNVVGSNNNYETTPGAFSKAGRQISMRYKVVDGQGVGNRAWDELERASDTVENREILKRRLEECLKPLVKRGEIKDVTVAVDDLARGRGLGAIVTLTDVRTNDIATIGVLAPWGIPI